MKILKLNSILAVKLTSIIISSMMILSFLGCAPNEKEIAEEFSSQEYDIYRLMQSADNRFSQSVDWNQRQTDEEGNPHVIGVLDPELDALLGALATAYSADPSNERTLTEEELRYLLTDGLLETAIADREAIRTGAEASGLYYFLVWTDAPADLVFIGGFTGPDGIEHFTGEVVIDPPTNYEFKDKEYTLYSIYRYAWE